MAKLPILSGFNFEIICPIKMLMKKVVVLWILVFLKYTFHGHDHKLLMVAALNCITCYLHGAVFFSLYISGEMSGIYRVNSTDIPF